MAVTPNLHLELFSPLGVGWREDASAGAILDYNMMLIDAASTGGGSVSSVFGRSGAIVALSTDYSAFYDATGSAASALTTAEAFATAAVSTEASARSTADALLVPKTTSVNAKALSGNITLGFGDIAAGTIASGTTATTQAALDNSLKLSTTGYADTAVGVEKARALAAEALLAPTSSIPTSFAWNVEGNATGNLVLANGGFASTFNQTSAVAWLWANTTAATAAGVNQGSPIIELSGTYFTSGASASDTWTIQSSITAAKVSATVTNVAETAGNAVTLTITGGSFTAGAQSALGTTVTFSGLTTATWLNGQNVVLLTASATSLTFTDPTGHGLQASHAETGTVTQNNPGTMLTIGQSGSGGTFAKGVAFVNINQAVTNDNVAPTLIWAGDKNTGICNSFNNGSTSGMCFFASSGQLFFSLQGVVSTLLSGLNGVNGTGTGLKNQSGFIAIASTQTTQTNVGSNGNAVGVTIGNNSSFAGTAGTQTGVLIGPIGNGSYAHSLTYAPGTGSGSFIALNVNPTINDTAPTILNNITALQQTTTTVTVGLGTSTSGANAYLLGAQFTLAAVTKTTWNGLQTVLAAPLAARAASPYTITNSIENASSVVTLTIGTHSVVANDWVVLAGLTTATWLNGQFVKVTSVVANTSITFTDLATHGTSATHADAGTVSAGGSVTFTATTGSYTGAIDTGTIQQNAGTYTGLLVNVIETSVPAVTTNLNMLLDLQIGGVRVWGRTNKGHEIVGTANNDGSGIITSVSGTTVSFVYAVAYQTTPTVVVTPTTNAGAFYLSATSKSGFTITYGTSGAQTFNYHVVGNPN